MAEWFEDLRACPESFRGANVRWEWNDRVLSGVPSRGRRSRQLHNLIQYLDMDAGGDHVRELPAEYVSR